MNIGEYIKKYRKENNISLREFAKRANCSHSYIALLEKGVNHSSNKAPTVTFNMLTNIADAMHMPLEDFLNVLDEKTIISDERKLVLYVSDKFDKLDNKKQKEILKQATDLINFFIEKGE